MRKYLLPETGQFYKANLHCHSTYSDGQLTPEQLKTAYKTQGYSVLAITDHEAVFDHGYLDDEDFLTVPGYEREINDNSRYDEKYGWDSVLTTHLCIYPKDRSNINCVCFDPDFVHPKFKWMHTPELKEKVTYLGEPYVCQPTVESINHIISEANKQGFLVTLNHPEWSQQPYEVYSQYEGLFALEIYNTGCERGGHNEENSRIYDALLRKGQRINCVAADDNHNYCSLDDIYSDSFGGFTMIKADALEHSKIISALEKGEYYSSTGPAINALYIEDDVLHIETSPARRIRLITGNRKSSVVIAGKEPLCSAEFKVGNVFNYFRVEVIDHNGEKAYTNAYFVDNL